MIVTTQELQEQELGRFIMNMRMFATLAIPLALGALLVLPGLQGWVQAATITSYASRAAFDTAFPVSVIENWDSFPNGTTFPDGSTTNGITYTTSGPGGDARVTNGSTTTSSPNSLGANVTGDLLPEDSIVFGFSSPITAFGIDILASNSNRDAGAFTATTGAGDVIPSIFDPFPLGFTPPLDFGHFVGFRSDTAFSSVTIDATRPSFSYGLDNMRGVTGTVPEPSTLLLLGAGLVGMAAWRWKRAA
jgi:hypothetical protein